MSDRPKRAPLGRGLSALLGDSGARVLAGPGAPRTVPIEAIRPSPFQPRRRFAEAELDGLVQSIREKGVIQPLLVRPLDNAGGEPGPDFELVAGERRWRAAQRAGLHEVPVVIRPIGDSEVLEIALVENLQREDLTPLEEAEAYSRLMQEFGRSQAELAETIGKSRSHVANMMRLTKLPAEVQAYITSGQLSAGHARALIGVPDPAAAAKRIVEEGLNVRQTEALAHVEGVPERKPQKARGGGAKVKDPDTIALEKRLSDTLGLRVSVDHRGAGGVVHIHYRDLDQLDEIVRRLDRGG